jgi:phosphatidylserine decarboxylase
MKIDRAGWPFVHGALIPAVLLGPVLPWLAVLFGIVALFMVYFFRDPDRTVPDQPDAVVSPADGRVLIAGEAESGSAPPGAWTQVSIFLSPLDVHINRAPVEGLVTRIEYRPGRFLPAYDARANENELNEIWVDADGTTVVFRQVVGILARRIVCRIVEGQRIGLGDRIGLMKFGSRMDVFLPREVGLQVEVGQTVIAGETILASLRRNDAA